MNTELEQKQHAAYDTLVAQLAERYYAIASLVDYNFLDALWQDKLQGYFTFLLQPMPWNFLQMPGVRGRLYSDPKRSQKNMDDLFEALQTGYPDNSWMSRDFIGDADDLVVRGVETTYDVLDKSYQLTRLFPTVESIAASKVSAVVEWGGGYGVLAKTMWKLFSFLSRPLTYTIIDLPVVCVMQWLYLSTIFGEDAVHLLTKRDHKIIEGKINLVPHKLEGDEVVAPQGDLFVSTWAISESSVAAVNYVAQQKMFGVHWAILGYGLKGTHDPSVAVSKLSDAVGLKMIHPKAYPAMALSYGKVDGRKWASVNRGS